jgi:hypothetical protein
MKSPAPAIRLILAMTGAVSAAEPPSANGPAKAAAIKDIKACCFFSRVLREKLLTPRGRMSFCSRE